MFVVNKTAQKKETKKRSNRGVRQRRRTPVEAISQRRRTATNKIKRINKSLETAGVKAIGYLKERLDFWAQQL